MNSNNVWQKVSAAIVVVALDWQATTALGDAPTTAERPPNIVLVLADDLGVNDLACYGRREHATPRLDALALQGMRFTCCYCAQPICSPSRAALLTGLSPARLHLTTYLSGRPDADSQLLLHPRIEGQLPLEQVTLAERLRAAGYATGIFGKWHLGEGPFGPAAQGFDVTFTPPPNLSPNPGPDGKFESAITSAAQEFIEQVRDRPFFCYIAHHAPHIPLAADPALVEKNAAAFHPVYAAMMESLDASAGRLLNALDSLDLADNTIVLFTSDNGGLHVPERGEAPPTHNSPYRAGKGYLYEGGLREPLLVRWPGRTSPGSVCDAPIVLTDLVPTLLRAAGIDAERTAGPLDGVDVAELLSGRTLPARTFYWHFPHYNNQGGRPAGAVREGDWKLIEQYEDHSLELYDLSRDVGETRNVASEQGETAQRLSEQLRRWRERVGAQATTPNPHADAALHRRLYVAQDSSQLRPASTAAEMTPRWQEWRAAMDLAVQGRRSRLTPAQGDVRLLARDARVYGEALRYEPEPHKNTLGYWTRVEDWAAWDVTIPSAGRYEVEVEYGCGEGSGGGAVDLTLAGHAFAFEVQETGHFQQMISRVVGEGDMSAGPTTLEVRPRTKPGIAVMDLRRVVVRPID